MSKWMREVLQANDLRVVETPVTHTQGGALDVHITQQAWRYQARTYTFPGKFSDHSLPIVQTNINVGQRPGTLEHQAPAAKQRVV